MTPRPYGAVPYGAAPVSPIVLVAHGSRDPRSARTIRELGHGVVRRWPGPVLPAFLDFDSPSVPVALQRLGLSGPDPTGSGPDRPPPPVPIVVPALLTRAYHGRVDLPEVLSRVAVPTRLTPVLGPAEPGQRCDRLLLAALARRLSELDVSYDGVTLVAAGTRDTQAQSTVESVAAELSSLMDVVCVAGYASSCSPTAAQAVARVRAQGARRVAVASYFLAPGRLHDLAVASARRGGIVGVAAPLGDVAEVVDLVLSRASVGLRELAGPARDEGTATTG